MHSIELESVSKVFYHSPALFNWMGKERSGKTLALDRLTLTIERGSIVVLLGPNGSGKTTTLKLASTMLLPDEGRVIVDGSDTRTHADSVRRHVGFAVTSERSFFPRLSARENLDFFAALDDVPRNQRPARIENMLDTVGLADSADTLVMKFSSGMYQRLGIARALIKQPSLLLLDEPSRSLDPASAEHFWALVRNLPAQRTTVLLASHSFQEAAAVADVIAVLQAGRLVDLRRVRDNSPEELRTAYFRAIGETDQAAHPLSRQWQ
jgi:ABC-2 type transport system ATP-binding protein